MNWAVIVIGALGGFAGAVDTDLQAFKAWHDWHDAAIYDWRTASFRWVRGIIVGALTASPIGVYFS